MLVLTRKSGEAIRIGETVIVTVVQMSRGRVRIGIEAPGVVSVHRGEIYDRIQQGIAEQQPVGAVVVGANASSI